MTSDVAGLTRLVVAMTSDVAGLTRLVVAMTSDVVGLTRLVVAMTSDVVGLTRLVSSPVELVAHALRHPAPFSAAHEDVDCLCHRAVA